MAFTHSTRTPVVQWDGPLEEAGAEEAEEARAELQGVWEENLGRGRGGEERRRAGRRNRSDEKGSEEGRKGRGRNTFASEVPAPARGPPASKLTRGARTLRSQSSP